MEGGKSGGKEAFRSKTPLLLNSASLEFPQTFPGTMPENLNLLRAFGGFFFIFWTAFNTALVDVVGSEQQIPLSV